MVSWVHHCRREGPAAQERAEAVIALSTEQGFAYWMVWGTLLRGWALAAQEQAEDGVVLICQSLAASRATGSGLAESSILILLAEAQGKAGQPEDGLATVTEALAFVERTDERWWEADLYRLKGALTLQSQVASQKPEVDAEAESCYQKAIHVARRQQAKSWELRAATSLARLWQQQGKPADAGELLSEIYAWFTEGFETADLKDAKALLDELG